MIYHYNILLRLEEKNGKICGKINNIDYPAGLVKQLNLAILAQFGKGGRFWYCTKKVNTGDVNIRNYHIVVDKIDNLQNLVDLLLTD